MTSTKTSDLPTLEILEEVDKLKRRIAALETSHRQSLALTMAASLVEEAAYLNASEGARPLTMRLMLWAQAIERTAGEVSAAA